MSNSHLNNLGSGNCDIKPYVYRLSHKVTGQFYIGYRCANKEISIVDLPKYKSSSKVVAELGFDNFNWEILKEFDDGELAYDYEQLLISEHIGNILCINKHYVKDGQLRMKLTCHTDDSKRIIREARAKQKPFSAEARKRMSKAKIGKPGTKLSQEAINKLILRNQNPKSEETKSKISKSLIGRINGPRSEDTKVKISESKLGKKFSLEHKLKLSIAAKARCERKRLSKIGDQSV